MRLRDRVRRRLVSLGLGLGLVCAIAVSPVALAQTTSGPDLTVVGFGIAALPPTASAPAGASYQLNFNLSATAPKAGAVLTEIKADIASDVQALRKAGVTAADISVQGPPSINYNSFPSSKCQAIAKIKGSAFRCPVSGYQASATLTATLLTLAATTHVLDRVDPRSLPGVQNFWLASQSGVYNPTPTGSSLTRAYAQALAQARATARMLASADHLTLGPEATIREGAPAQAQCTQMGGCPVGLAPGIVAPSPGPDQMLVAVTVTFHTER